MPTLLALETATDACSVALLHAGETLERYEVAPRRHTELILPMVNSVLAEAGLDCSQIDAIAFGAGPGSFTGVRIATAVAQGLALAHDLPVVPVSCLALLAIGGAREHDAETVVPVMDARRHEVYAAAYVVDRTQSLANILIDDWIGPATDLPLPGQDDCLVVGRGVTVYHDEIRARAPTGARLRDEPAFPRARDALASAAAALASGTAIAPEFARPLYLRHAV
ncbi:MAG: tRNA (adenosine(37)-N6)-threonylcarbamoyltransferase complex dimerization subunit type 1 TsaB [Gammaproteobacteria bacterium]|jgi:tRNA threonylcarbamoyladenosine biosynthesis protein TsaB